MNSKEEDIYNWAKEYLPGLLNMDYSIDDLEHLYYIGKDLLGKFKTGDYISYEWIDPSDKKTRTAVVIFQENKRGENGNVERSIEDDFIFKSILSDVDIFGIDEDSRIGVGYNFGYSKDMRIASDIEISTFLKKVKKYFSFRRNV